MSNRAEMTRQKLLLSAREVASDNGVPGLTIEAVARHAGVSKGAVLYHFPSKDQLLSSLLAALLEGFERAVEEEVASTGMTWLRAYLRASFPGRRAGYLQETRIIFAIVAVRPELSEVVEKAFRLWHERAREGESDTMTAHLVRAAIDGLWYNEMFGLSLEAAELERLLVHLERLLQD